MSSGEPQHRLATTIQRQSSRHRQLSLVKFELMHAARVGRDLPYLPALPQRCDQF
jgi:hypothetical protein